MKINLNKRLQPTILDLHLRSFTYQTNSSTFLNPSIHKLSTTFFEFILFNSSYFFLSNSCYFFLSNSWYFFLSNSCYFSLLISFFPTLGISFFNSSYFFLSNSCYFFLSLCNYLFSTLLISSSPFL